MKRWRGWLWSCMGMSVILLIVLGAPGSHRANGNECRTGCKEPQMSVTAAPYEDSQIDVAIIGSELEGLYLAARAKQAGLHPLVLEPSPEIGGQLLRAQMQYLDGVYDGDGKPLMQGGFRKLFDAYMGGAIRKQKDFADYVSSLLRGIPVEAGVSLGGVQTDGAAKVTGLSYRDRAGKQHLVRPAYFVDNSDAAVLTEKLGVQRLPGLEALYGKTGKEYMSATLMIHLSGVDWQRFYGHFWQMDKTERVSRYGPETFVDPNLAYGFPPIVAAYPLQSPQQLNLRGLNILNQGGGEVLINALQVYDVDSSDPESVRKGLETARKELPYIRDHLRRNLAGFEQAQLDKQPDDLYIREFNHYPTEYVLQASDLLSGRMFWDNVSVGGYFLDIQGSKSNREGLAIGRPDKYGLPLRSYLLKQYDNVVLTGKLVGSTAVAYGSTRIQANGSLAAETIGMLMGEMKGRSLKTVTPEEMSAFQDKLAKEQGIVLQPPAGRNLISGLSEQDVADLNKGFVTLLPGGVVARHLPFIKVRIDGEDVDFKGVRPLMIDGTTWLPLEETYRRLGAQAVKVDVERGRIDFTVADGGKRTVDAKLNICNNHVLIGLSAVLQSFPYKAQWDEQQHRVILKRTAS